MSLDVSSTGTTPEVRVVDDVAVAGLALFLEVRPRTIQLSGGSTPKALYELMAGIRDYPWSEVEAFFGDERCVAADDDRSDVGMAMEALLSRVPARTYPIDGASCDADGYERTLRGRFGDDLSFDLAVYGLGPDGHTASLFPGRPEVEVGDRWVVHVPEAGWEPFVPRVSLTVPALSATPVGVMLVAGEDKRRPLHRLLSGEDIPAARLRPGRLLVLADEAAAGGVA
jgi:6-phosphogluconolactonase